jgi:hypothetical protein
MACEELRAKIKSLQQQYAEMMQEMDGLPASEQVGLQHGLNKINDQIKLAEAELYTCLHGLPPHKVAGQQPQHILEIRFQNPAGFDPTDDWAPRIANGTFPIGSDLEWKQVLDSEDEYDQFNSVGATGWAINPRISHKDTPVNHPFGLDWLFDFALDAPYTFLLARGNSIPEDDGGDSAASFDLAKSQQYQLIPPDGGLLGVEWDSGLVPPMFLNQVDTLDRVAVFGRWIVDCGHNDHDHPYRSEIHPPLLMASASVYQEPDGTEFTRTVFTSRPYLVGQTFSVDTADIYDDSAEDDGYFYGHLVNEVIKAETIVFSQQVEAHPKIKSHPFRGIHVMEIVVRTPQPSPNINAHISDLTVSFHFTVRSGCAVQVIPNDDSSVRVLVALNHVGYTPPNLPHRNDRDYSLEELKDLSSDAGLWIDVIEGISALVNPPAALILDQGVKTDEYDPFSAVDLFDAPHAVTNARANNIPGGMGISQDNSQPYPVYGWLDVKWVRSDLGGATGSFNP